MDSDSDSEIDAGPARGTRTLPVRAAKLKTPLTPQRVTRATASHFDIASQSSTDNTPDDEENPDSEDDSSDDGDQDDNHVFVDGSSRKRRKATGTSQSKRLRRNPARSAKTFTRQLLDSPPQQSPRQSSKAAKKVAKSPQKVEKPAPVPNRIIVLPGDWAAIPYMVWLGIFEMVAMPLRDGAARPEEIGIALQTLISATYASKILTEPALTALYKSPCLSSLAALGLSRVISLPADRTMFNYRPKVESLRIEVGQILAKKIQGNFLSLKSLIQNLPRLKDLELYHESDQAPYRELKTNIRWTYPDELFEALESVQYDELDPSNKKPPTQLRSWTWSSRLAEPMYSLEKLESIHRTPGFSTLKKLTFVNYQVPSLEIKNLDDDAIIAMDVPKMQQLAAAIAVLPHLEHLSFESSTLVNGHMLSLLPKNLKHLQLVNCWDVNAEVFADFLLTHGSSLEQLTLDHCQWLSLAFLPVLRDACPKLTHLSMNLKYFRSTDSYNDANPDYDVLLGKDQIPTWPSSLQWLDIQHMRRWGGDSAIETATMFFKSLVDSASHLPNLRHLALKANINAGFKDRARFRDEWVRRMHDVFKRPVDDPKPVPRRPQALPAKFKALGISTTSARRSTRLAERPISPTTPPGGDVEDALCSQRELTLRRRVLGETERLKNYHADDEHSEDELASPVWDSFDDSLTFKQRLCNMVDIQVDNQKTVENEYDMGDFLNPSSSEEEDPEWNGVDEVFT
jgi:hypothetical protein